MGQNPSTASSPSPVFDHTRAIWVGARDGTDDFVDALLSIAGDSVEVVSRDTCKYRTSDGRRCIARIASHGEYMSIHGDWSLNDDAAQYCTPGTPVPRLLKVRHPSLINTKQLDYRYWSVLLPDDAPVIYDIGHRCIIKCGVASLTSENSARLRAQEREYVRDVIAGVIPAWSLDLCLLAATYHV